MVKAAVFSDFDGTITLEDSNDFLTDTMGFGKERRLEVFQGVLDGNVGFRHAFKEMLDSVDIPFDDCVATLLKNIRLDPGFKETFMWCHERGIPFVVISSGMLPLIKALISELIGPELVDHVRIIANDVEIAPDGSWSIVYRDETAHGHDKSRSILQCKNEYNADRYYYCGDGVSDLTAARECDVLFAREGRDLIYYCDREGIPYIPFSDFNFVKQYIESEL